MFRAPTEKILALVCSAVALSACGPTVKMEEPGATAPTWFKDAQPLIASNCTTCHYTGGVTPFALETFDDVKAHATQMKVAIQNEKMPPWMPSSDCAELRGARRLSPADKATLLDFLDDDELKQGDAKDQQQLNPTALTLPWVDKSLKPSEAYTPKPGAGKVDDYRCFMMDPNLTGAKDLIGFEVTPGARAEVHHVLLYSVTRAEAEKLENESPGFGWPCFGGPGTDAPKMIGGWVPGTAVTRFPGQTGVTLFQGDVVVMQVHYNTAQLAAPVPDQTKVDLQFAANPVPYHAQMFPLVDNDFRIPPRAMNHETTVSFELPVPATIWGVVPHLHTKGLRVSVEVIPPATSTNKTNQCLVNIPKWDFQWQQFYFFTSRTGIKVEANSKLKLTCAWANPTDLTVKWGEGTDDEMCLAFLYVTGQVN